MSERRPIIAVIQARMNSERLPGKVLLPLAGRPLLEHLLERCGRAGLLDGLVVATTDTSADDPIVSLCDTLAVSWYRGDEYDVISRILGAAKYFGARSVVRLTADNPFVDGELIDLVVRSYLSSRPEVVYAHNVDDCGFPHGLFVEVMDVNALELASANNNPDVREHVTWAFRTQPDIYPQTKVTASAAFKYDALTVDTEADYRMAADLFRRLYLDDPAFGMRALARGKLAEAQFD